MDEGKLNQLEESGALLSDCEPETPQGEEYVSMLGRIERDLNGLLGDKLKARQNIVASPTSSVAHIYACACANVALGVAITLDDKELIADTRTLKDILELHFRKMLFEKEELTNG